jgi:hypothetical protein
VKALEDKLGKTEEWIDCVMWDSEKGGIFGHMHLYFVKEPFKQEIVAFTDAEEIEHMREIYEKYKAGGKVPCGAKSFVEWLECWQHLCEDNLKDRQRAAIEKVRAGIKIVDEPKRQVKKENQCSVEYMPF